MKNRLKQQIPLILLGMVNKIPQKLAILGLGKLGSIILQGFLDRRLISRNQIQATVAHPSKAVESSAKFGVPVSTDNCSAAAEAQILFLCVKPHTALKVCEEIRPSLHSDHLLISVAASVPTSLIENVIEIKIPVIRAMPNTPCQVGSGMTGICAGRFANDDHINIVERLFSSVGRTAIVEEKDMNAVTGLSASGPAFIYVIIESLTEAGVQAGLTREVATLLAAQTVRGAAEMVLKTGEHPAILKDRVATPGGCTMEGLKEIEEGQLRKTFITAVAKTIQKAGKLLPPD
jgi:pyrroline-5-carboxylate reductase